MTRREIRETAFRILFGMNFHTAEELHEQLELYYEDHTAFEIDTLAEFEDEPIHIDDESWPEVCKKAEGCVAHLDEIDAAIEEASHGWKLNRMTKMDLTLIRLAVYEIRYEELAAGIAINEAVELAKHYGTDKSAGFVNGVLAKLS